MITVLGYQKCKGSGYNVSVAFDSSKDDYVGRQVAECWVKDDTFEAQFADVQPGDVLALNVRFNKRTLQQARTEEWYPYIAL